MSREILFRGKRIDNGEWVYGVPFFIESEEKAFIINNCSTLYFDKNTSFKGAKIDFETIGQYTGFSDRNEVKIFDGDVIMFIEKGYIKECVVVFTRGMFSTIGDLKLTLNYIIDNHLESLDVIGNIHDK